MGLARLDDHRATPGEAVNGGARSAPFISSIDGPGWGCCPVDQSNTALFMKGACANGSVSQFMLYPMGTDISDQFISNVGRYNIAGILLCPAGGVTVMCRYSSLRKKFDNPCFRKSEDKHRLPSWFYSGSVVKTKI